VPGKAAAAPAGAFSGPEADEEASIALALALLDRGVRLSGLPAAMERGQDASDELVTKAKEAARKLLQHDVALVRQALGVADPSPNHLRVALVQAHGRMEPRKLAALVYRVLVLSELAGRLAAAEQARIASPTSASGAAAGIPFPGRGAAADAR
jgi:inorganic triphosphatase YgiF